MSGLEKKPEFFVNEWFQKAIEKGDFNSMIVSGSRGVGKSVYALKLAYSILKDWELVFRNLYYDAQRLYWDLKARGRLKLIVIDDAGVGFSNLWYHTNRDYYRLMSSVGQILRTEICNLVMTAPNPQMIVKPFREMNDWFVKVSYLNPHTVKRRATVFKLFSDHKGSVYTNKLGREFYRCWLPEDVWERYQTIRKEYINEILPLLKSKIEFEKEKVGIGSFRKDLEKYYS